MSGAEQAALWASSWAGLATALGAALVFLGAGQPSDRPDALVHPGRHRPGAARTCRCGRQRRQRFVYSLSGPAALAIMLGLTAGVMTMVSAGSLLPEAWAASHSLAGVGGGVAAGALLLSLLDWLLTSWANSHTPGAADYRQGLLSLVALALHNLPEGMAVAVAYLTPGSSLGPLLAAGIALHNLPEGLAISTPLAAAGLPAWRAWAAAAATGLMEPLAAFGTVGWIELMRSWDRQGVWFARGTVWAGAYGLAAGAMMYVVLAEILPAVRRHRLSPRLAAAGLLVGVLLMGVAECWLT